MGCFYLLLVVAYATFEYCLLEFLGHIENHIIFLLYIFLLNLVFYKEKEKKDFIYVIYAIRGHLHQQRVFRLVFDQLMLKGNIEHIHRLKLKVELVFEVYYSNLK